MRADQRNRRGSALVLALIVVTVVAILSMGLLNLNRAKLRYRMKAFQLI